LAPVYNQIWWTLDITGWMQRFKNKTDHRLAAGVLQL
jgi:hypothetical protein